VAKGISLLILLSLIAMMTLLCWWVLDDFVASLLFASVMSLSVAPLLAGSAPSRGRARPASERPIR
jgi:hypothetical protein